ncbi:hypothetical protein [Saccharopolyspora erythraea]|nr:hypothetical protein [Saccharopolyspora erythraea]QRK92662.1 hypothetical protein JQX30_16015 [Saccharopolyspora erythraea]
MCTVLTGGDLVADQHRRALVIDFSNDVPAGTCTRLDLGCWECGCSQAR